MVPPALPFIDLKPQMALVQAAVQAGWERVLAHGQFIMGPEVAELEADLSAFCGCPHVVTCANGTDALSLALLVSGIGPGDAVFCPSWTFSATAEAVCLAGATPVFVDVRADSFNLCIDSLVRAVAMVQAEARLTPRAVIAVDLYGLLADYPAIAAVAEAHGLLLISDAAQAFGATLNGHHAGTLAPITTTSFFPAKPLGCWGDGGAVLTGDAATAEVLRSLRVHGKGTDKYDNVRIGMNSRLDTLQAVVLREKLKIFADEIVARQQVADWYGEELAGTVAVPVVPPDRTSVWAQYTIRTPRRDQLQATLRGHGIPTQVYYPKPLHLQTAYDGCPMDPAGLPVTERLMAEALSLPMHPYLPRADVARIGAAVRAALA